MSTTTKFGADREALRRADAEAQRPNTRQIGDPDRPRGSSETRTSHQKAQTIGGEPDAATAPNCAGVLLSVMLHALGGEEGPRHKVTCTCTPGPIHASSCGAGRCPGMGACKVEAKVKVSSGFNGLVSAEE